GCGGSGSGSDGTGAKSPGYTSAKQVAEKLKCTYYSPDFGAEGATDSGACQFAGDQVVVAWFKTAKVAKAYYAQHHVAYASGYGDAFLYGTNWALECPRLATCGSARKVLGGKLVGPQKNS
ncbi:MAG: hypothetical protein QOJ72_889, partial [Nocardioidaceae bacterium]|nr:hypothetical protein [Nocardioidaceae bacterium]